MIRPMSIGAALPCLCLPMQATAQVRDGDIVVEGARDPLTFDQPAEAGSRLGLTLRDTFNDVVGAIVGSVPGNPAVVSLRGFSGNTVSILQDGVRVAASTIVQHDADNWRYGRTEVLKGPAAVLYGEGALAGVTTAAPRSFEIARASRL